MGETLECTRDEHGRWITAPVGNPITPANARTMATARWEKHHRAFAAGVVETLQQTGQMPPLDDQDAASMHVLGAKAAAVYMDSDSARGLPDLLRTIVHTADWLPDMRLRQDAQMPSLPPDVDALLLIVRRGRSADDEDIT